MGRACASTADCADTEPCTTNERCDPAARVCLFDPLDGDRDGHPPRVCGGDDCDDSNPGIFAGHAETCNGRDDNCDGLVDEAPAGAECGAAGTCVGGACRCPSGRTFCPGGCVDTQTDGSNCGRCGATCAPDMACVEGRCACAASRTLCGAACVDAQTDSANCGACGNACPSGASCRAGACQCGVAGLTFCAAGGLGVCADTSIDPANCGACGRRCAAGVGCAGGSCVSGDASTDADAVVAPDASRVYPAGPYGSRVCTRFEPFTLNRCNGDPWSFADNGWGEANATVVIFAASWSVPSQREALVLEAELVRPYAGRGVRVVTVLVQNSDHTAITAMQCDAWQNRYRLTHPVLMDPLQYLVHFYPGLAFPANLIVDRQGRIRYRAFGSEMQLPAIRAAVDEVLMAPDACTP